MVGGWEIEVKQLAISWAQGNTLPVTWHAPNETLFISDGKKKIKKMCKEYMVKVKNILLIKSSPWKNETWDQAKLSCALQNWQHTRKNSGHFAVLKLTSIEGKIDHCCFSSRLRAEFLKLYIFVVSSWENMNMSESWRWSLLFPPFSF